jgi:hypothetical protein
MKFNPLSLSPLLSLSLFLSREKEEQFLHGRNHGEKSWLRWELNP